MADDDELNGVELIAQERWRQAAVKGHTPQHDRTHTAEELVAAALCYAMPVDERERDLVPGTFDLPRLWPWARRHWKPTPQDRVRELTKAGALIAAEIDRLLARGEGAR